MNNAEVLIKFTANDDEATKKEKEQEQQLKTLQKTGENVASGLAVAVDAMAAAFVGMGISYNAEIETYLTRLTTLTGSAEKANAVLDQIKQDALKTPFDVKSLTQAEALLLSTGITAEQARDDIINLGNAISASGGGNAELQRMAVNLQQIKNVGKASALDIKQFAYAGIDVYGLLADSLGITKGEVADLDITYEMLSNALSQASKEGGKYYGAMEAQSKTMNGAMSNLQESFQVFAGNLSEGVFNAVKGLIPQLTAMFDWLTANKDIIMAILVPILTFINIFGGFFIVMKVVAMFQALWAVLLANPIVAIIALIGALVAGFIYLWNNCEGFRNFFIAIWEAMKIAVEVAWNFIIGLFKGAWNTISGIWNNMVNGAKSAWEGIKNAFSAVGTFFKNIFSNAWNSVLNVFSAGGRVFNGIKEGIFSVFKNVVNHIISGINTVVSIPFNTINKALNGLRGIDLWGWKPFSGLPTINAPQIPYLNVGTNYVPEDTMAMIHKGEAVIPKKFNPYANGVNNRTIGAMGAGNVTPIVNVYAEFETDPIGQVVSKIKTFSGGAKNDFNYGQGVA